MQTYFLIAAIVSVLVGIVHSLLGEILIFRKLRAKGLVPTQAAPPLESRNVRILWATWHAASVFGFGFSAVLFAAASGHTHLDSITLHAVICAFVAASALVLIATKGKHPGWLGLLAVAVLVYLGSSS